MAKNPLHCMVIELYFIHHKYLYYYGNIDDKRYKENKYTDF